METKSTCCCRIPLMLGVVSLLLMLCVTPSASTEPPCVIPEGESAHVDTNPHMPIGGVRCPAPGGAIRLIQYTIKRCEDRYCCEEPCDCDTSHLYEHTTDCDVQGKPSFMKSCFVRHAVRNITTLMVCCADYVENEAGICVERPCKFNNGGCSHTCVEDDTTGLHYHCECPSHMTLNSAASTKICIDRPCLVNKGGCSHQCVEDDESGMRYHCECPSDMALDPAALFCVDRPCRVDNGGCSHDCVEDDDTGLQYHCECPTDLVLDTARRSCVDPCSSKNGGCAHLCVNDGNGLYHCVCYSGYQLQSDGHSCGETCEMLGCSQIQICVADVNGDNYCACPTGYVLDTADHTVCNDIDECSSDNGGCSHQCINEPGTYHCQCPTGLHLHADEKTCQNNATPQPRESTDEDDDSGPSMAAIVGSPLALLLLLVLLIPLLCLLRRRRGKKSKEPPHVGDDSRAFANTMYDVTPGQAPVLRPVVGGDGPKKGVTNPVFDVESQGAVGPEPHYDTLPPTDKKRLPPGGIGGPVVYATSTMPSTSTGKMAAPLAEQPRYMLMSGSQSAAGRPQSTYQVDMDNHSNITSERQSHIYAEIPLKK